MRILILTLLLLTVPAFGQQPAALEAELAPPVYSTLAQSGGVKWIAYGFLYPVGTFAERVACEQPEGVEPIGSYAIRGEFGDASAHAALYRVTFGRANDGKQFVFAGIVEFVLSEINQPEKASFSAARLIRGNFEEGWDAEFTPRSTSCFGGRVKMSAIQDSQEREGTTPMLRPDDNLDLTQSPYKRFQNHVLYRHTE